MKKIQSNNTTKIAIIVSRYRAAIGERLVRDCMLTLTANGITQKNISVFPVPGALEIPLVAKKLAKQKKYDAIIVFGVVLRGNTYHFEQVADECSRGCMNVSYDYEIPVVFQVLCVYTLKDAVARSSGTKDNRGIEGAQTALTMIELLKNI